VQLALESALCVGQQEVHLFLWGSSMSADSLLGMLAIKAAGRLVLMKHCWVSWYCSLHHCTPRKLNTPLLLFSDLGRWFRNKIFHFLYCGMQKAFFGQFGHIQHQVHVGLFQLYPTTLPCHSCSHVENLQDIS
jgi:hypothetical protein